MQSPNNQNFLTSDRTCS